MDNPDTIIEIAAFSPEAAITAAGAGADRIELCSGYYEGGLSPSAGSIMYVRKHINIPLHVMIRPRIGDFIYSEKEKEVILEDIQFCKQSGVEGIVCGVLLADGKIDKSFTKQMVETASPLSVTFHRAFDLCPHLYEALDTLISCGVRRLLTSGGKHSAPEGTEELAALTQRAAGKIIILPGGGIRPGNVAGLITHTGVKEIHFSAKELKKSDLNIKARISLSDPGSVSDILWYECNPGEISAMKDELRRLNKKDK